FDACEVERGSGEAGAPDPVDLEELRTAEVACGAADVPSRSAATAPTIDQGHVVRPVPSDRHAPQRCRGVACNRDRAARGRGGRTNPEEVSPARVEFAP